MISKGISHDDKIISMRFVELAVMISQVNEDLGKQVAPLIDSILKLYFQEDILVKVSLIELITSMCKCQWNSLFVA